MPHENTGLSEAPLGLWFQVECELRPLRPEEFPAAGSVDDDRMVVFAEESAGGMTVPRWRGLYAPLAALALTPDFIRLFADPGRPRAARVREFYATYGPLRETTLVQGTVVPAWANRLAPEAQRALSPEARLLLCEPLWWVKRRARELRLVYDLYLALRADDPQGLRSLLPSVPQGVRLVGLAIEDGRITPYVADEGPAPKGRRSRAGSVALGRAEEVLPAGTPLRPLSDEECRSWGRQLLAGELSKGERRSQLDWYVEDLSAQGASHPDLASGVMGLVRTRRFDDLTAAMYVQLAEMMARGEVFSTCPGCGGPFHPLHGRQKYCHPRCGDADRQRRVYRKPRQPRAKRTASRGRTDRAV